MNGAALTPNHGAPVRLVVPGWYGCSWIKWVDAIRVAAADEPTTSQMRGVLAADAPGRHSHPRAGLRAATDRSRRHSHPRRKDDASTARSNTASSASSGAAIDRSIDWRSDSTPATRRCRSNSAPPAADARTWALWDYRWRPTSPASTASRCARSMPTSRRVGSMCRSTSAGSSSTRCDRSVPRSSFLVPFLVLRSRVPLLVLRS